MKDWRHVILWHFTKLVTIPSYLYFWSAANIFHSIIYVSASLSTILIVHFFASGHWKWERLGSHANLNLNLKLFWENFLLAAFMIAEMANNDEFTLIPPSMVADAENSRNFGRSGRKLVEFRILQPDNTLHALQLPQRSTGNDCIDQVY